MVIGTIFLVAAAPGLLGTQEAIRQSQQKEKREEHRARRCGLIATCVKSSIRGREVDSRQIVLVNNRLYVDTGTADDNTFGHPFAGYYLPYPDEKYEGMVTTITDVEPMLNWIYIDRETYQVKHGIRANAQPNLHSPFDCTRQDRRLTFEGWEGFVAVEEEPYLWSIYFDRDDNGLSGKVPPGTRVLEIELTRREKKWKKDPTARKEEQCTAHAVSESTTLRVTPQNGNDQTSEEATRDAPPIQPNPAINPSTPPKPTVEDEESTFRSHTNHTATMPEESTKLKLAIPYRPKRADSVSPEPDDSTNSRRSSSATSSVEKDEGDNNSATSEASTWSDSSEHKHQEPQADYTPVTPPNASPRKSETPQSTPGRLETICEERPVRQQLRKEALDQLERSQNKHAQKDLASHSRHSFSPGPPPKSALLRTPHREKSLQETPSPKRITPKTPPQMKTLPQSPPPRTPPRTIKTPLYESLRTELNSPYSPLVTRQRNDWRQSQQTVLTLASRTTLNLNSKSNPLEQALFKFKRLRSAQFREYCSRVKLSVRGKMKPKLRRRGSLRRGTMGLETSF